MAYHPYAAQAASTTSRAAAPRGRSGSPHRRPPAARLASVLCSAAALSAALATTGPERIAAQNPCMMPPAGMVAWYPLDEVAGATTVIDIAPPPGSMVNNVGITLPGPIGPTSANWGPVPVVGQVGGAHYFYAPRYEEVAPQAELDFGKGDFSIDAWIRNVGNGQKQAVVDKLDTGPGGQGFALYFEGWFLHLNINGTTFTSVAQISHANPMGNTGPWYHVAATVNRSGPSLDTVFLYIDGAASPMFVPPVASVDNALPLWIGSTRLPIHPGEIAIDELEIFNRALSGVEVNDLYLAGPAGKCKPTPGHITATHTPGHFTATHTPTSNVDFTLTPTRPPTPRTPIPTAFTIFLPVALSGGVLISSPTSAPTASPHAATSTPVPSPTPVVRPTDAPTGTATSDASPTPDTTIAPPTGAPSPSHTPTERSTSEPTPSATPTERATGEPTPTAACAPQPAGMAAWWPLDETGGVVFRDAIGGHHGTVQGVTVPAVAKVGPGRLFDGATGYIAVPSSPALDAGAGDFSIDAWINPDSDALQPIVTKQYAPADAPLGYALSLENRRLAFEMINESSAVTATAPVPMPLDGQWHLVAVTIARGSATGGRLYLDGALVHTFDTTPLVGAVDTMAELHIAERPVMGRGIPQRFFSGGIDEVEIFHRALTAAEVASLYAAGSFGKCDKPPAPEPTTPPRPTPPEPQRGT